MFFFLRTLKIHRGSYAAGVILLVFIKKRERKKKKSITMKVWFRNISEIIDEANLSTYKQSSKTLSKKKA